MAFGGGGFRGGGGSGGGHGGQAAVLVLQRHCIDRSVVAFLPSHFRFFFSCAKKLHQIISNIKHAFTQIFWCTAMSHKGLCESQVCQRNELLPFPSTYFQVLFTGTMGLPYPILF